MSNENKSNTLIERKDVKIEDTWDLTLLYKNDEQYKIGKLMLSFLSLTIVYQFFP